MEPWIGGISTIYDNGDSIGLRCTDGICDTVVAVVEGDERRFVFDPEVLYLDTERPILFRGTTSEIDFAFRLYFSCPDGVDTSISICYASFSVVGDEIVKSNGYRDYHSRAKLTEVVDLPAGWQMPDDQE